MEDMVEKGGAPVKNAVNSPSFWRDKSVFLTGHTGFKGSWLSLWLHTLGAQVTGYSLDPPTVPNLYQLAGVADISTSIIDDVRDGPGLLRTMNSASPDIVFHLAAQPLVRESYLSPVDTYSTNVMGTVNLLEAVRHCPSVRAVVNVTTDKCYENRGCGHAFHEDEMLGGYDPYSSSKACSELVTAAYRTSYFNADDYARHRVAIATARAGNVIGGGDWGNDRLIPDIVRSLLAGVAVSIRNPQAVRPWQHVLEPLSGYLLLARKLYEDGPDYAEGWNFGPSDGDTRTVEWIVNHLCGQWGPGANYVIEQGDYPHEAHHLKLDCSKAAQRLGWYPRWNLEKALTATREWVKVFSSAGDVRQCCLEQIERYEQTEIECGYNWTARGTEW